ncbi:50S ribosomal protein L35 [bacterium endosymbiont of Pedicinus badii]|uniref:50S ribosomal protein L35 n=1 Tax=bacterium endosymbiont of Pedicinus badii TaxID=1719126 RepID=UPI0009BAAA8C|nr:50S ribosomal protein L35 [bacterium endosymbiont of Pedicinus badii]OQM34511.1 50S ribosomal protein L35 [bacterium endosymbiont of Pedicinus badii]
MNKIKTLHSAAKRFKRISLNKIKRKKANLRHILTKKNSNRKRKLRKKSLVSKSDISLIKRCLPNF